MRSYPSRASVSKIVEMWVKNLHFVQIYDIAVNRMSPSICPSRKRIPWGALFGRLRNSAVEVVMGWKEYFEHSRWADQRKAYPTF